MFLQLPLRLALLLPLSDCFLLALHALPWYSCFVSVTILARISRVVRMARPFGSEACQVLFLFCVIFVCVVCLWVRPVQASIRSPCMAWPSVQLSKMLLLRIWYEGLCFTVVFVLVVFWRGLLMGYAVRHVWRG